MTEQCDVVVVGAGPAGSSAAIRLSRRGFNVVLLDRAHFPRHKACGEYLSPGVLAALDRLTGRQTSLRAQVCPTPGMDIIASQNRHLRLRYTLAGSQLMAGTLSRYDLDQTLFSMAQGAGSHVQCGFVARGPLLEGERVVGVRGTVGGQEREIRARLTVIADGSRSALARALKLSAPARWPVRLGLVAHYEGQPALQDGFGQMHVSPAGYCGVVQLPDNRVNVAMVVPRDSLTRTGLPAKLFFEQWVAKHENLASMLSGCSPISGVRGVVPVGVRATRLWTAGAVLIGDAGGFFDPFTGEGVYRALRGAELMEEVCAPALHSPQVPTHALQAFGRRLRAEFRGKEAVTSLVQLFVQYPALMHYALPRLAARDVPSSRLASVLGDVQEARVFLNPQTLWAALRP